MFGAPRLLRSGTGDTDFRFTGEQLDSDEGLYYLRARYYDPELGRFLAQDPIPAANLYAYVGNNPVNYVDPAGLCHERLGWDQLCGYWAHKPEEGGPKEGGNFERQRGVRITYLCGDDRCEQARAVCYGPTLDACVYLEGTPWWEQKLIGLAETADLFGQWLDARLAEEAECWQAQGRLLNDLLGGVAIRQAARATGIDASDVEGAGNLGLLGSLKNYEEKCRID